MTEPTKTCGRCGVTKPLEDYPLAAWCKDGRRGTCRSCRLVGGTASVADKTCNTCGDVKPIGEFPKRTMMSDGHMNRCRDCHLELRRAAYWKDPKANNLAGKKWRDANPEKVLAGVYRWKAANRELVNQRGREYERNLPLDVRRARSRAYREAHPEVVAAGAQRYRARMREALVEEVDLDVVWIRQCGVCAICRTSIDPRAKWPDPGSRSVDHSIPLSRGGEHRYTNVTWTHLFCNQSKGAKLPR